MMNIFYILKLLNRGYSLLRALQIIEVNKINFKKKMLCADLGSLPYKPHNISTSKKIKNIKYFNLTVEKKSQKKKTIIINFEKIQLKKYKINQSKFDNVFLFNLLEHIYNYKRPIFFSKYILKKNGLLIGSTPFLFRIHGSPQDYYRFTDTLLEKDLKDSGFQKIKVKILGSGIFTMFFNSIMVYNRFFSPLNCFFFLIALSFDSFLNIFSQGNKKNYPIGYFFLANKK